MTTLVSFGLPARIHPHPGPGFGFSPNRMVGHHYGGGFGHHLMSFMVHMAIWHAISRIFYRFPALMWMVLLGVLVALVARWLSRRTPRVARRW